MNISPATKAKIKKIAIGTCLAAGGAGLTYLSEAAAQIDWGWATPLVTAGFSVAINVIRKWLFGY